MSECATNFTIRRRDIDAVIFDLDGVVTKTATVHARAWKSMFDAYMENHAQKHGIPFVPFDEVTDYLRYVDGKPRYDGVRDFLASRDIVLPWGSPDNPPDAETVCGLGNRKNEDFHAIVKRDGVETFDGTISLIHHLRELGIRTAIISSSRNCQEILQAAEAEELFEERVDGGVMDEIGLPGKPAPDIFLEAARRLGVKPSRSVVVEDAISGVQAGAAGSFAIVIGIDRSGGGRNDLLSNGADVVVDDLCEIAVKEDNGEPEESSTGDLPSALDRRGEIATRLKGRTPAVFLDYDGVLTPIVRRPEDAVIGEEMRKTVHDLSALCRVAIVSGRDLRDVKNKAAVEGIVYAGSHGFDIESPGKGEVEYRGGIEALPALDAAEQILLEELAGVAGARIERKKFAIAVHFREVEDDSAVGRVEKVVDDALRTVGNLRKTGGKKIFELRPDIDWNKGKAILFVMEKLGWNEPDVLPFYIGDDLTDEDAFRALRAEGIGIVVRDEERPTLAVYALENPDEVRRFLLELTDLLRKRKR
jgi:trehalose 6-phosphate phosphatase